MIYFDLDGVIRDLCTITNNGNYDTWDKPIDGLSFSEFFNQNLHLLLKAPATEYFSVIANYPGEIKIITVQPEPWRPNCIEWVNAYLGNRNPEIIFENDKLQLLSENDLLVEDYPLYEDYSQIILIDRPYNWDVKDPVARVKTPMQLWRILNGT